MKKLTTLTMLTALAVTAVQTSAQVFTAPFGQEVNLTENNIIPDADLAGLSSTITMPDNGSAFNSGFFMQVKLNIEGYLYDAGGGVTIPISPNNGDYYAYLSHAGRLAILLNRPGKDAINTSGYNDPGMHVILQDFVGLNNGTAANDIHTYRTLTGFTPGAVGTVANPSLFAPDGRNVDPVAVDTTTARTALLSVFNGVDVKGDWTLFIADVAQGGEGKLTNWGLNFIAVPEPHQYALIAGLALIGFALYRRYSLKAA